MSNLNSETGSDIDKNRANVADVGVQTEKRARRPLSYADASSKEPCEGRSDSPSNPTSDQDIVEHDTHVQTSQKPDKLDAIIVLRCTKSEKQVLRAKAEVAGVTSSQLLREALGLVKSRRRKKLPNVAPSLTLAVARIGGNLNQIARQINIAAKSNDVQWLNALAVVAKLVSIERQLSAVLSLHSTNSDLVEKQSDGDEYAD